MNETPQPNYVLIDTPDKQLLFAPMKPGDEWAHGDQWQSAAINKSFTPGSHYRRLERNAWLPIKDKPVQYPAWLLPKTGRAIYYDALPHDGWVAACSGFFHWLPAPPAPEGPVNEDEEAFQKWFSSSPAWTHDMETNARNIWQAGRDYERSKRP